MLLKRPPFTIGSSLAFWKVEQTFIQCAVLSISGIYLQLKQIYGTMERCDNRDNQSLKTIMHSLYAWLQVRAPEKNTGANTQAPAITNTQKDEEIFQHGLVSGWYSYFIKFQSNCFSPCHTNGNAGAVTADSETMPQCPLWQSFSLK